MSNPDFVMTQRRGDEDGLAVSDSLAEKVGTLRRR